MLTIDPSTATENRCYPCISLLVPLDGASPWTHRLRQLQRDATARLRAEFGPSIDPRILDHLDHAAAATTAAPPPGARSVAVYVNADGHHSVGLGVTVRERAVIDDTFATRDLIHHDLRRGRYWVLALALAHPRLLQGHGPRLHPEPLRLRDTMEPSSNNRHRRGRDRTDVADARRARRLRALDMALTEALAGSRDPLIVVGAEPTLSKFLHRTRHGAAVERVIRRAPDHDLAALATIVAPAVAEVLAERRTAALAALDRAVNTGNAVSGIHQVWRSAHRYRGALVLVEEHYALPARVDAGGGLHPADDATAAGVVDDIVDETLEQVLARHGRVEIVPDGALTTHQRIALVPAPRRKR
ncbi:MAG: hypothetical protein AB1679_01155 [Actinomycetota bacterium]